MRGTIILLREEYQIAILKVILLLTGDELEHPWDKTMLQM